MSKLWKVDADCVMRGKQLIAEISTHEGLLRWDGMGMFRWGFKTIDQVIEDVIYFHRYPQKRVNKITFKSGRIVTF